MLSTILILGCTILLLVTIAGFLLSELPRKFWFKFILIPIVFFLGVFASLNIKQLMGYPFDGIPQGHFQVEDARLTGNGRTGLNIEFWALSGHGQSRLYSIPYDPKTMQMLEDAIKAGRSGQGTTDLHFNGKSVGADGIIPSLEGQFNPLTKSLPPKGGSNDPDQ